MGKYNNTPTWMFASWLNKNDICRMLYGEDVKKYSGIFTQKRQGDRAWDPEELVKLDEIRKKIMQDLM